MHLIIDFDYTLFDTERLRTAMKDAALTCGVSAEQFQHAEQVMKTQKRSFTVGRLLDALPLSQHDHARAQQAVEAVLQDTSIYLYRDSLDFLLRHQDMEITILSAGDPGWQERKIFASGVRDLVASVIATERPKEQVIQELRHDTTPVFVNDRGSEIDAIKSAHPTCMTVWVQRSNTPYTETVEPSQLFDFKKQDLTFDLHTLNK